MAESSTHKAVDFLVKQERRFTIKECAQIARDTADRTTDPREAIVAKCIADKISLLGKEE